MDSSEDDISTVISEVLREAASLNYKSIFLPLSQVDIPAKKRKDLVNYIANDIQRDNLNKLQKNQRHYRYERCEKEHLRNFKLVGKTVQKVFNFNVSNILV